MILEALLLTWLGFNWKIVLFFMLFPLLMGLVDFILERIDPRM